MTFLWPWPKVTAVALINKNLLVCRIKWEPLNQSLQNLVAISHWSCLLPVLILDWLFWKLVFCQIFFENSGCVFSRSNTIWHISGMIGPIIVKRKGGASVGCWVNHVTLAFDLTHDLNYWFFKVKFKNSCISGIVIWLIWNKKKGNQLDTGLTIWSCPLTKPMTLTL